MTAVKEYKTFQFEVKEAKEVQNEDGVRYGVIKGLLSTYGNVDDVNDMVIPGAFAKSLERYKSNNRIIPMMYQHKELIGGFPISTVEDTVDGLMVKGDINLEVQRGREAYALAKQGVLGSLSIGYKTIKADNKNGVRCLKEVDLLEGSMVADPANKDARIFAVKSKKQVKVKKVPMMEIAPESHTWDKEAAINRVRRFTNSTDKPSASYKKAFMWHDKSKADDFTAYKLPFVDIIDGKMKVVPRALAAIAAVIDGGRGGVDIPESDKEKIKARINRYYAKMDKDSPFKKKAINLGKALEIKTQKEFESILRESGVFTKNASTYLASCFKAERSESVERLSVVKNLTKDVKSITEELKRDY